MLLLYNYVVLAFTNQQQYWMRTRIQSRYQTSIMSLAKTDESWILIVEDENSLRNAIGKYISEEGGYYVTGVSDAQSALLICKGMVPPSRRLPDFISQHTYSIILPDCIVLDIQLNGEIDGIDLLRNIRSDSQLESIPVVLLTAKGRVDDRIAGYNAGADAYLPKPFDAEELLVIINGLKGKNNKDSIEESDNTMITDIRRELKEIKALLNEDASIQQQSNLSADSIYKEVVKIKEDIITATKTVSNDDHLTQSSTNTIPSQYNTLSILTPEETKVINYVCQDLSNKEIARNMVCSISKIEKSMSSMFKKANVTNRGDLTNWWKDYSKTLGDENANKVYKTIPEEVRSSKPKQETSSSLLTEEEVQVVEFLERGYTTDEIASASKSTKKNITKLLNNLIKRADVVNRTELVQWWKENGIND